MARKSFGGQCGDCATCGKCDRLLRTAEIDNLLHTDQPLASQSLHSETGHSIVETETLEQHPTMEQDTQTKLYTFLVYSENVPGLLSQITAVFTRRQVNIESLNVCASSTPGAHKYTITAMCDEAMARVLTSQVEKRIEVLQAHHYTDDQLFINETALFKISTPVMLQNPDVGRKIRLHNARIVEVNNTYAVVEITGITRDILSLFDSLKTLDCILQFVRSGRICITKSPVEHLDKYLAVREAKKIAKQNK